jgi:hypothetical protein
VRTEKKAIRVLNARQMIVNSSGDYFVATPTDYIPKSFPISAVESDVSTGTGIEEESI